jgi:hypothetical protein
MVDPDQQNQDYITGRRRAEQDRLTEEGGRDRQTGANRTPTCADEGGGRDVTEREKKTVPRQADRKRRNGTGGQEEVEWDRWTGGGGMGQADRRRWNMQTRKKKCERKRKHEWQRNST